MPTTIQEIEQNIYFHPHVEDIDKLIDAQGLTDNLSFFITPAKLESGAIAKYWNFFVVDEDTYLTPRFERLISEHKSDRKAIIKEAKDILGQEHDEESIFNDQVVGHPWYPYMGVENYLNFCLGEIAEKKGISKSKLVGIKRKSKVPTPDDVKREDKRPEPTSSLLKNSQNGIHTSGAFKPIANGKRVIPASETVVETSPAKNKKIYKARRKTDVEKQVDQDPTSFSLQAAKTLPPPAPVALNLPSLESLLKPSVKLPPPAPIAQSRITLETPLRSAADRPFTPLTTPYETFETDTTEVILSLLRETKASIPSSEVTKNEKLSVVVETKEPLSVPAKKVVGVSLTEPAPINWPPAIRVLPESAALVIKAKQEKLESEIVYAISQLKLILANHANADIYALIKAYTKAMHGLECTGFQSDLQQIFRLLVTVIGIEIEQRTGTAKFAYPVTKSYHDDFQNLFKTSGAETLDAKLARLKEEHKKLLKEIAITSDQTKKEYAESRLVANQQETELALELLKTNVNTLITHYMQQLQSGKWLCTWRENEERVYQNTRKWQMARLANSTEDTTHLIIDDKNRHYACQLRQ